MVFFILNGCPRRPLTGNPSTAWLRYRVFEKPVRRVGEVQPPRTKRGLRMDKTLVGCTSSSKLTDPFGELKVFSGSASKGLAQSICQHLGIELARAETV